MSAIHREGFILISEKVAKESFYNDEKLFVSFNCSHIFTQINFESKLLLMDLHDDFEQCFNLVKMKNVFPHKLNDTFFYVEEIKESDPLDKQLLLVFK